MRNPRFDLVAFSQINLERCDDPKAFNCGDKNPTYFGMGLIEEAAEVGSNLKKLERGFNERELKKTKERFIARYKEAHGETISEEQISNISREDWEMQWKKDLTLKLVKECADVFTFLDLICSKYNLDLFTHVREKFNKVSEEMKVEDKYYIHNIDGKN